ncbi:hypothetical protein GCM10027440_47460 [Nocardiopsis coralliicola]
MWILVSVSGGATVTARVPQQHGPTGHITVPLRCGPRHDMKIVFIFAMRHRFSGIGGISAPRIPLPRRRGHLGRLRTARFCDRNQAGGRAPLGSRP